MTMKIQQIPLSKIVTNKGQIEGLPKNPRVIRDAKFKNLVQSITDDPEMLDLRELIIFPIEDKYIVICGNMRLAAVKHLKHKDAPCKVLPEDTPVEKLRAYAQKDNVQAGENDWDALANEWEPDELFRWGVTNEDFKFDDTTATDDDEEEEPPEDDDLPPDETDLEKDMVLDVLYGSDNDFEIPSLLLDQQAGKLELPVVAWGSESRLRTGVATYHFYVDDYRFDAIFKDPAKLIASGVKAIVEPNTSLYDQTPLAYGLHMIYKKRWLARWLQEIGIKVYVDLNVSKKFYLYNKLGVPKGYDAFMTRGYTERITFLEEEIQIAQEISGKKVPNLIVYGGGSEVQKVCQKYSLLYVEQFINRNKNG